MPLYSFNATTTVPSGGHAVLARHFEQHHDHLVTHLASRLPAQARAEPEDAAQRVWRLALMAEDPNDDALDGTGFPAYLGRIIDNLVACEQAADPDPEELWGMRGHESFLASSPAPTVVDEAAVAELPRAEDIEKERPLSPAA